MQCLRQQPWFLLIFRQNLGGCFSAPCIISLSGDCSKALNTIRMLGLNSHQGLTVQHFGKDGLDPEPLSHSPCGYLNMVCLSFLTWYVPGASMLRSRGKTADLFKPKVRNCTASLWLHPVHQNKPQGQSRSKGKGSKLHSLIGDWQGSTANEHMRQETLLCPLL